jgi:hypothetical protein
MRLPILAAAVAMLVTPALAQSDASSGTDTQQPPAKHMTHAKKKHKKMSHTSMSSTKCGPQVKTEQTSKAKPCT